MGLRRILERRREGDRWIVDSCEATLAGMESFGIVVDRMGIEIIAGNERYVGRTRKDGEDAMRHRRCAALLYR